LGSQFTYGFDNVSTNNNDLFFIFGNEIRTASVFDYESKKLYIVYVRTTDVAGAYYTRQFIINVKDTNDLPSEMLLNNSSVSENRPTRSYVGKLSTTDADQFGNFTYSLVSGDGATNNNDFLISNDSLLTNNVFNYENKKVYNVRLRSTDASGGTIDRQFNINITDDNDAPTQLRLSNNKLFENDSVQKQIGVFTVTDEDINDQHSYTLAAGAGDQDNALFIIDGNSLFSNFIADYELKNTYNVRIKTEDKNGETIEVAFVININDTKEKPSINNQAFIIKENEPAGTLIGVISSTSPDVSANLRYSIISATDLFEIDEISGALTNTVAFDYEKTSRYKIKVLVRDNQSVVNVLSDTAEITINIADEIELNKPLPVNNFMSPDGDGVNDFFEIENVSLYADYSLKIFNDIGIELYSTKANYQNDWNGMVGGNRITNGVYYYLFYNTNTGKEFKGTLNVFVK
jgi:gliding motility-associated-like protein